MKPTGCAWCPSFQFREIQATNRRSVDNKTHFDLHCVTEQQINLSLSEGEVNGETGLSYDDLLATTQIEEIVDVPDGGKVAAF